ncbi:MAG: methyltransferase domain-containing protein [Sedimentisphaerales bacterium]|nr:methyltransferase domain-containing protein [Sedimentisphaerales bacterium]
MEENLKLETQRLAKSWMRHDRKILRDYLVKDVEDPRINVQSILTRHFFVRQLFGEQFDDLMEHELRFSLVMNWVLQLLKKPVRLCQLQAVLDALLMGEENAEEFEIPPYVTETFSSLALPNYICDVLSGWPVETCDGSIPAYFLSTFLTIWQEVLDCEFSRRLSVLEPACGSANDFRFIDAYGIGQFLDYTGFDLCGKNICNAKQMFPDICFKVGNVLEIDAGDKSFDYCFVHDLFEHLSIEAMEVAIGQMCRVARRGICAGFFNMHENDRHVVRGIGDYHWNTLSVAETKAAFEQYGFVVQVIHIDSFLRSRFDFSDTHNKRAYTFILHPE